ncbi:MAG: YhbY family RNA-binding protein [Oligoflexales bacterium]|nr:YhbY family RNA-binding protein [Oligoflexales bacterium]
MNPLGQKQIKYLKGLGHELSPVLWVGKEGVTPALLKQMAENLRVDELIKVRIQCEEREEFTSTAKMLAEKSGAFLVQTIGRMALYYLEAEDESDQNPATKRKKPKIRIP